MDFKTDKEVMSRMVDHEQEVLRLKGELNYANNTIEGYREATELIAVSHEGFKEKAKAWDDLEALLKSDNDMVSLGFAKYEGEPLVKYNGVFYGCSTIAEGVSNALESIKGES